MSGFIRAEVRVDGIVQGVGFRPFVHRVATRLGLRGVVGNDERGVVIEVEGASTAVAEFVETVRHRPPPLATVDRVTSRRIPVTGEHGFRIAPSTGTGHGRALISPDVATCDDCLRELFDPADRRYGYPFINCTACGPRFTIVRESPYDRATTTMASFAMCEACASEYHDPASRRFHAQPVCCAACGPRLRLLHAGHGVVGREPASVPAGDLPPSPLGDLPAPPPDDLPPPRPDDPPAPSADASAVSGPVEIPGDPVEQAARLLRRGAVLAVKGIGGYHLAVRADSEVAVTALRARKRREERPLAVMVPDLETARALCHLDAREERLLTDAGRPIVLLRRRTDGDSPEETGRRQDDGVHSFTGTRSSIGTRGDDGAARVAEGVAAGDRFLGVMLPYSPVHHLLLRRFPQPIVLTSGNASDEPIAYADATALERLGGIADAFLLHDRAIHIRADDSVVRVVRGRELPVRRSRGHVPRPARLTREARRPVLGCGAELKHTFCLAEGRHAFVSHHIGDLENYETLRSFTGGVRHFERLFGIRPELVAHDLHPEYLSTKYALEREDAEPVGVQHHHAHIASCLADNGVEGPVIGVAFDGLGYGLDGTLWGGEFLVADLTGFRRAGHLATVPMPGGATAIRQPWRMAAAYLAGTDAARGLAVRDRNADRWDAVVAMAAKGVNAPLTSSAGRLFDAVAALTTGRDTVTYEGQAAIELERVADRYEHRAYSCRILDGPDPPCAEGTATDTANAAKPAGHEMSGTTESPVTGPPHTATASRMGTFVVRGHDLVRAVLDDLSAGVEAPLVSARFHNGVARLIVEGCARVREHTGLSAVALSGGVFQNAHLVERTAARLEGRGFTVLTHTRVPPNDGGISLGQVAVAAARDR
ncbi:carbamoyltransferase HypF [Sphaerisporangium album]|uniref:carbamoyltransferase HypF n=1 Tax=Sphaerisporangium album TaxID=509200 RepID=UPI001FE88480|nr:carbamoyltransferase HypF [Sphaerisporangium album]